MMRGSLSLPGLAALLLAAACGDDPNAPHALGTITLGERHGTPDSRSVPVVTAAFAPDSRLGGACTRQVAGCTVTPVPICDTICTGDLVCGFDVSCRATCYEPCSLACPSDQECYFPSAGTPSCRARERFDAGSLTFSGTTVSIELYPPYLYAGMATFSPFLDGANVTVAASGTTGSGFEKFTESFKATSALDARAGFAALRSEVVYGAGPVPLSWPAGPDRVLVGVQGPGGAAACDVDDAAGRYQLPREVIRAVQADFERAPVTLSVTRKRTEVRKGKRVRGAALSTGWLELATTSTESASYTP